MNPFKMPPQILRLVILTATVVVTYGLGRVLMTPATYGDYGAYRGAAIGEIASANPVFSGMKACDECHSEVLEKLAAFKHQTLSCESCHGPSREHANDPDINPPKVKFADGDCLRCHQPSPSRPLWLKQVDPIDHYRGKEQCTDCHLPHSPNE